MTAFPHYVWVAVITQTISSAP